MQDNTLQKDITISIDKLCIVADFIDFYITDYPMFYSTFVRSILDLQNYSIFEPKNVSNSYKYQTAYLVNKDTYIEYSFDSKSIRIEFNPNKVNDLSKQVIKKLLFYTTNIHFTRLDIACDLFNYNFKDYNITSLKPIKKAFYYSTSNALETAYIGSLKSNRFFRIYNKALEQKIKDIDWWRVELQLRDIYIDRFLNSYYDFFSDILIYKYNPYDLLSFTDSCILNYLLEDTSRLKEINDKRKKKKFKDLIRMLELDSLNFLHDLISLSKSSILTTLNTYLINK